MMIINNYIELQKPDLYIYNLNLTITKDVLKLFSDIKCVILQGSHERTLNLTIKLANIFNINHSKNLFAGSSYVGYRVGNILLVSHGMGNTSIVTLLHSLSKLLYYADSRDAKYIRVGTSGGIGVQPGSIILTDTAFMPNLIPGFLVPTAKGDVIYPTKMNHELNLDILQSQPFDLDFEIIIGNTIAADDFYLGQARFDGAITPKFNHEERSLYFKKLQANNIYNFEMESTALAGFCNRAKIDVTMIAVTLIDRLQGDQIKATDNELALYLERLMIVVINYLKSVI